MEHDNHRHLNSKIDTKKKVEAIGLSIGTAAFLTFLKLSIGLVTHSLGLIASAVDSLMDVLVSTVNLIAAKEADKPADKEHLYGHGKIESLAGLFQSLLISGSGIYLIVESIRRLVAGTELTFVPVAIGVMAVSMFTTTVLVIKLRQVLKETESIIIGTEELHFTTDLLTNGGVIIALVLVHMTGTAFWDLVIAVGVAVYILKQATRILKKSIDELLDRAFPVEEQKEIEKMILNFDPKIVGFHNLRTRKIGQRRFIDFHFEIKDERDFMRAHELTESLIRHIQERFTNADVTVHYDPEGAD
jgi:ferrous-iron efflux pump FieF